MKVNCVTLAILAMAEIMPIHAAADTADQARVQERGEYLVRIGGCNDCHTPDYPEAAGEIPQERWLTGVAVGFQGPWGTSYPANLRRYVQTVSAAKWLERVRQPMRPPMPWFNLRDMTDEDLLAIYRFIHALGPAGEPAPPAAEPGAAVTTPYFDFVPKNLPQQAAKTP